MANLELDKTLQVDGVTYDINAVKADKVVNSLVLTKKQLNGDITEIINFNGSNESGTKNSLEIVPSAGGRFSGRITVPNISDSVIKNDGETVLNYNDIVRKVVDRLLNTSAMATWNKEQETLTFTEQEAPAVHGICVVLGTEDGIYGFTRKNKENYEIATSENQPDSVLRWLPHYLYICTDTGSIYLGAANSTQAQKLSTIDSNELSAILATVDLASDKNKITTTENGPDILSLGVSGILPETHGGTGEESIETAIAKSINTDNSYADASLNRPGMNLAPRSIQVGKGSSRQLLPHGPDAKVTYDSYGINMRNSDIINVNGMWFADKIGHSSDNSGVGEGIMFLHRDQARAADKNDNEYKEGGTSYSLDETDTWDRFYVRDGVAYILSNENINEEGTRCELIQSENGIVPITKGGTGQKSLSAVTVGQADKIKVNYKASTSTTQTTKYANITIAPSSNYPNGPTGGNDGDIMILF